MWERIFEVSVVGVVVSQAKAVPGLAWQASALPRQLIEGADPDRRGVRFLAAVAGTAVLGVVDWPVAALVAGGYLLSRQRPAAQTSPMTGATGVSGDPAPDVELDRRAVLAPLGGASAVGEDVAAPNVAAPPVAEPVGMVPPAGKPRSAPPAGLTPPVALTPADAALAPPALAAAPGQERAATGVRAGEAPAAGGLAVAESLGAEDKASAATAPWPGYDTLTVPQVVQRLDAGGADLDLVARYETANRGRKMVLAAVRDRRRTSQ